jgi:hypothetical protein
MTLSGGAEGGAFKRGGQIFASVRYLPGDYCQPLSSGRVAEFSRGYSFLLHVLPSSSALQMGAMHY